ncbi:hypothetical protein SAMN05660464_0678 [Geodermatophilus dictyosporus]|uniref:Uncharacterized protein n=1 Tax=Geodermatophilus dictyosporus TaxID=1523247 RepID=A0A1I5JEH4_9ACTN|nr:hypothetical protein [Geodermatophilus dictyosporus]SFO71070.1 hypothetical protein SAMN05660464_0678 [Geodermatophilus dictyosporus]
MQTQQFGAVIDAVLGARRQEPGRRLAPSSDDRGGPEMTRLRTALIAARAARARRRDDREIARALATAPTLESAHEIAALAARR